MYVLKKDLLLNLITFKNLCINVVRILIKNTMKYIFLIYLKLQTVIKDLSQIKNQKFLV
jgi:hypothetical protein